LAEGKIAAVGPASAMICCAESTPRLDTSAIAGNELTLPGARLWKYLLSIPENCASRIASVAGEYSAVGGAVSKNGVDAFVFVPAGPVGEFGGGVIGPQGVGLCAGTPEKFPGGLGGEGYLNITSNAASTAAQSHKK
jgi:hypothetical protein